MVRPAGLVVVAAVVSRALVFHELAPRAPAPAALRRRGVAAAAAAESSADEEGMVRTLERLYGPATVLGDLNAAEARRLYHSLLPRVLAAPAFPEPTRAPPASRAARKRRLSALRAFRATRRRGDVGDLRSRATAAAVARRAAKRYARKRSWLVLRQVAHAGDAARYFAKTGRWSVYGAPTEELVERYVDAARRDAASDAPGVSARKNERSAARAAYRTVLEKSVSTNELLDRLLLDAPEPEPRRARTRADAFWRTFPLRPAVLFRAVAPVKVTVTVADDTDAVWDAFLLRCVEPGRRVGDPSPSASAETPRNVRGFRTLWRGLSLGRIDSRSFRGTE